MPSRASKVKGTRYLDIDEDDGLDEAQISAWIEQTIRLPGVRL
ncbi:hypothetical protein NA8A_02760 [Nitratireductor indicus C115]|uniref:Uncharacterized protein n=1 Tax=Nitratireductor indicus C115 TaxID=1231190 RepID=K2N8A5_9HYPH|nr:hypothetical protein NA8A_02760 [Nitratireductor indicus C115]